MKINSADQWFDTIPAKENNLWGFVVITNPPMVVTYAVGRYPTIKLGTRKLVSKRIIPGIDGRRLGMKTQ